MHQYKKDLEEIMNNVRVILIGNEIKKIAKEVAKTFDYKRVIPMYENLYCQVLEDFRK